MMKVHVRLFAAARQAAENDSIELIVPADATVSDVKTALLEALPALSPLGEQLRFAVNADYASSSTQIGPTDEVACIPPVSGG